MASIKRGNGSTKILQNIPSLIGRETFLTYFANPGNCLDFFLQVKTGKYSYTSPEGELIEVTWIADENGFRAEGVIMAIIKRQIN